MSTVADGGRRQFLILDLECELELDKLSPASSSFLTRRVVVGKLGVAGGTVLA